MKPFLYLASILFLLVSGCKTPESNAKTETLEQCVGINQLLVSPINIVTAFANHQLGDILENTISLNIFDSTQFDGTPMAGAIDFGKNSLCKDEHKRGGIWILQWHTDLVGEIDTVWLSLAANYSDSGYQNTRLSWKNEDVFINGNCMLIRRNAKKYEVVLSVQLENTKNRFSINQLWQMEWVNNQLNPISIWDLCNFSVAGNLESIQKSNGDKERFEVSTTDLVKIPGCLKGFTKGKMMFENSKSEIKTEFEFDPFNDSRCDEFALLIQGKLERLISLW